MCLCLSGRDRCWSLQTLGKLFSLKELYIFGMKSIKTVGTEFNGSGSPSFQPFPCLRILSFEGMLEWEEWDLIGDKSIEFPNLSYLSLKDCPKLKGTLPSNLSSIDFDLSGYPLLVSMVCPELREKLATNLPSSIVFKCTNFILDLTLSSITSPTSVRDSLPIALWSLTLRYWLRHLGGVVSWTCTTWKALLTSVILDIQHRFSNRCWKYQL